MVKPQKKLARASVVGGGLFNSSTATRNIPAKKGRRYNVPKARKWALQELQTLMIARKLHSFWIPKADEWMIKFQPEQEDWTRHTWVEIEEFLKDGQSKQEVRPPRKRRRKS